VLAGRHLAHEKGGLAARHAVSPEADPDLNDLAPLGRVDFSSLDKELLKAHAALVGGGHGDLQSILGYEAKLSGYVPERKICTTTHEPRIEDPLALDQWVVGGKG
jgi:hypothetical protein